MAWKIVDGPREYQQHGSADIDIGWGWTIERDGERRDVRVEVAGGRLQDSALPDECRRLAETRGESALRDYLDDDEPPRRILATTAGIRTEP